MNARWSVTTMASSLCVLAGLAAAQDSECCAKSCEQGRAARELTLRTLTTELPALTTRNARLRALVSPALTARVALTQAQPEAHTRSRTVMIERNDEHEYKVEMEGDEVKAWVDGERVPDDCVKVKGGKIRITDEDGNTVKEFSSVISTQIAPASGFAVTGEDDPIVWEHEGGEAPTTWTLSPAQPEDHPPVMLGINMGSLDGAADESALGALAEQDLSAEDAIVVMSVIEGLPADEAGLREGDVIVRLDGEWGASGDRLREVLTEKEPGDELELLVFRDGRPKEITVELAEYDSNQLGQQAAPFAEQVAPYAFGFGEDNAEMRELLEKLQAHQGEFDEEVQKLIERLHKQQFDVQRFDSMPRFRMWGGENDVPRALVQPTPPAAPGTPFFAPGAEALEEQQEQLDRIEERLERLEDRLDRVLEALESRERDG